MQIPKISPDKVRKNFEIFLSQTEKKLNRGQKTDIKDFSTDLYRFSSAFEKTPEADILVKKANQFAEKFTSNGNNNFAGVIYSFLLKVVKNPKIVETLAVKQLAIAKRTNDPIHIMARTADIRKVYQEIAPNSPEHLKWLREEVRSIRKVINHYEHSTKNFKSVSRDVRPKEFYEEMLGFILVDVGKILKKQSPKEAMPVMLEAKEIFAKLNNEKALDFVNQLIKETESKLKK